MKNQLLPKNLLVVIFVAILATFFISFIGFTMSKNAFPSLLEIWNRWDTRHYIEIAKNGYDAGKEFNIAFFPLYPMLIKIFTLIFRDYVLSALMVSNIAYIAASVFLYKLVLKDFSEKIAFRTVFYLSIFPTAYFLHAGYCESLLLFLSIASLYYARKEKWFWAGSLGLLASLTKITGVILLPVLLIEYLFQKKFRLKDIKTNILWLALAPLGFLYYLFINYQMFGDAFRFLEIMKNYWHKTLVWPWKGFLWAAQGFKWRSPAEFITMAGGEIIFALLGLFLIILAFKYLRPSYGAYAILVWLIMTSTSFWLSIPRYTLWLFPIFIVLALITKKRPVLHYPITIICLILYSTSLISFIQGYWAW